MDESPKSIRVIPRFGVKLTAFVNARAAAISSPGLDQVVYATVMINQEVHRLRLSHTHKGVVARALQPLPEEARCSFSNRRNKDKRKSCFCFTPGRLAQAPGLNIWTNVREDPAIQGLTLPRRAFFGQHQEMPGNSEQRAHLIPT